MEGKTFKLCEVFKIFLSVYILILCISPLIYLTKYTDSMSGDIWAVYSGYHKRAKEGIEISKNKELNLWIPKFQSAIIGHKIFHMDEDLVRSTFDKNGNLTERTIEEFHRNNEKNALLTVLFFFFSLGLFSVFLNHYLLHLKFPTFMVFASTFIYLVLNMISWIGEFFYNLVITQYVYGILFTFITMAFYIAVIRENRKGLKSLFLIIQILLILWTSSYREYNVVILGFIYFSVFICYVIAYHKFEKISFLMFIISICFFFYAILCDKQNDISQLLSNGDAKYNNPDKKYFTIKNFLAWGIDTSLYMLTSLKRFFNPRLLPFSICVSLFVKNCFSKNNLKINLVLCICSYLIIFVVSFSVFFAGLIWAAHYPYLQVVLDILFTICTIILFSGILQVFDVFLPKLYIKNNGEYKSIKKTLEELITINKKYYVLSFVVFFIYVTFVSIGCIGLPIRLAWKDTIMGNAKRFYEKINQDYIDILNSNQEDIVLTYYEGNIPFSIFDVQFNIIDGEVAISNGLYSFKPRNTIIDENGNVCIIPMEYFAEAFDKKSIMWIQKNK